MVESDFGGITLDFKYLVFHLHLHFWGALKISGLFLIAFSIKE